jgi:hypothetical protein
LSAITLEQRAEENPPFRASDLHHVPSQRKYLPANKKRIDEDRSKGFLSKKNRGDRTGIELFWDALKAWPRALLKSCYGLRADSVTPRNSGTLPA